MGVQVNKDTADKIITELEEKMAGHIAKRKIEEYLVNHPEEISSDDISDFIETYRNWLDELENK